MSFTSFDFVVYLAVVLGVHWALRGRAARNLFLLCASYVFYGWIEPRLVFLLLASTVGNYLCGLGMLRRPERGGAFLTLSVVFNLTLLGFFKYFDFFTTSIASALGAVGWSVSPLTLGIAVPVGISFFTFQVLSYTIDVHLGRIAPRRNAVDFALFVALFPQLVAGPIERAASLLPQLEGERHWSPELTRAAIGLLAVGFFKKLVIADNIAAYVDRVFLLSEAGPLLLLAGSTAFALQILADFSAYTDIARGSAALLGIRLSINFDRPYLAVSPSDFWRRWHISLSTWIRDYLYIPLGGRRGGRVRQAATLLVVMALCGLWHGAQWNFVCWGLYHGLLLAAYRMIGRGGSWSPQGAAAWAAAAVMFLWTVGGWAIFRTPSMSWLAGNLSDPGLWIPTPDAAWAAALVASVTLLYGAAMVAVVELIRSPRSTALLQGIGLGLAAVAIVLYAREAPPDFIYFRF